MLRRFTMPRTPMARNSAALMANTVVTSALGYLFWILVVRTAGAEVNGIGAAFASGVQLVTLLASVGAAAAMVEWLPRADTDALWRQLVTTALILSLITSLAGSVIVVALSWTPYPPVPGLRDPLGLASFVASCLIFGVGAVVDYVCIADTRGVVLLGRNAVMTGLRIPAFLLGIYLMPAADALFVAWTVSAGLSLVYAYIAFRRGPGRVFDFDLAGFVSHANRMRHSLVGQHLIQVTAMLVGYSLPLLVSARLSPAETGYYYITWMLGSVFFIISPAVATALFAASASDPADTAALARKAMTWSLIMLAVPVLAYLIGGRWLLVLFGGSEYADAGSALLIVLTLSAFPDAVTNVAVAVLRATGRMTEALAINATMAATALIGTWLTLDSWGIIAAGVWWLAAQSLGAVWALANWRRITWAEAVDTQLPEGKVSW